jgi:hypothetical protein
MDLLKSPATGEISKPNETERDMRVRLQQLVREQRDSQVEALRAKYAPKIATMQERIRRAQQAVDRETTQASQAKIQTAISIGTTLLGAFLGRKAVSRSTLGTATTAMRGVGRSMKELEDIGEPMNPWKRFRDISPRPKRSFNLKSRCWITSPPRTSRWRPSTSSRRRRISRFN